MTTHRTDGARENEALLNSAVKQARVAVRAIQRFRPELGPNPIYPPNVTALMVPDFYHGEWVRYSDHERIVAELCK